MKKQFEGICPMVERLYRDTESDAVRRNVGRYITKRTCRACGGRRLKPEVLAVKLDQVAGGEAGDAESHDSLRIAELCEMSVDAAWQWVDGVELAPAVAEVCGGVLAEVGKRLGFLREVGLGYLSLDRTRGSLSGGEGQRVRLATQIGSGLSGVVYVLDEPSVGLHASDNARLIAALKRLRDLGNTVVVVEHDEAMIRAADWVIDLGPVAGAEGGHVLAAGTPEEVMVVEESVTGQWLRGELGEINGRALPAEIKGEDFGKLVVRGARAHNLQDIDVEFPLGRLVCVTGPSGSGKSTLVDGILRRVLARELHGAKGRAGAHDAVEGIAQVAKLVVVDQSPLGRSPRSNAATYSGAWDEIRAIYAKLPLSRQRGYKAGRFSFNVRGGRCEKCQGDGVMKIDMHFLADAYVRCDACDGQRFNRETLEVLYKGRSIAQVLEMTASEAHEFFQAVPKLAAILGALCEVGLGYLKLGQAANTLSGGESQRVKLAAELGKGSLGAGARGNTLYVLDEPTTGLHFVDVQVLMQALFRLRDAGNSLIVVEHHEDVVRAADVVVELGPGGGVHGGQLVSHAGTHR